MAQLRHNALTVSLAMAASLTVALTLSGCFSNPIEDLVDQAGERAAMEGAENLVEGMTGGGFDVELDGSLPQDFPTEVPLVDGDIKTAMTIPPSDDNDGGWIVGVFVEGQEDFGEQARQKLVAAGFEETLWNESTVMTTGGFTSDSFGVSLSAMADPDTGGGMLSYTVVTVSASE